VADRARGHSLVNGGSKPGDAGPLSSPRLASAWNRDPEGVSATHMIGEMKEPARHGEPRGFGGSDRPERTFDTRRPFLWIGSG